MSKRDMEAYAALAKPGLSERYQKLQERYSSLERQLRDVQASYERLFIDHQNLLDRYKTLIEGNV